MNSRWRNIVDAIRSSYWFVPLTMVASGILFAFVMVRISGNSGLDYLGSGHEELISDQREELIGKLHVQTLVVEEIALKSEGFAI